MADQTVKLVVGGDVQAKGGTYLKRPADDILFRACLDREFAYVLASRQIGKSSLKNAVAERLIAHGIKAVRIDLNRIGRTEKDADIWYFSLLDQLASELQLEINLDNWWDNQSHRLSLTQRFLRFFDEVALVQIEKEIVVFIDEIDLTLGLEFTDDFFAAIRVIHNDRSQNASYKRLTFVLIGVATPDELISDNNRTPFNIGKAVTMRDFTLEECLPLRQVIEETHPKQAEHYFRHIYNWTNGHPYLTQKLCSVLVNSKDENDPNLVDRLVDRYFLSDRGRGEDNNLPTVQSRVQGDPRSAQILQVYGDILSDKIVLDDEKSLAINRLKVYGLAVAKSGRLVVRNRLYREVFNKKWVSTATLDIFVVGGTLRSNHPGYIERDADRELLRLIRTGEFVYVLSPRQLGKSSLMVHTAEKLRTLNTSVAIVDLSGIGTVEISEQEWFLALLRRIERILGISVDVVEWWQEHTYIPPTEVFIRFLREVVLVEVEEDVVIFVDEIDTTLRLPFTDDFFAGIRALYNMRASESIFERLTFVLLGVASPSDLVKDHSRTPFNIGQSIELNDFTREETRLFKQALWSKYRETSELLFDRIYYWTSGHPYLTQKLCSFFAEADQQEWTHERIDAFVEKIFFPKEGRRDVNLQFVSSFLVNSTDSHKMLGIYRKILEGKVVNTDKRSHLITKLILSGLVRSGNGRLHVRNRIYRTAFDLRWVREASPRRWYLTILPLILILIALLLVITIGVNLATH